MMTIITTIIVGAIVGALARFVMPGHQNISTLMTVVLGVLGSLIGSWLVWTFTSYHNANGGFEFIPFVVGVLVACGLIAAYLAVTNGRSRI